MYWTAIWHFELCMYAFGHSCNTLAFHSNGPNILNSSDSKTLKHTKKFGVQFLPCKWELAKLQLPHDRIVLKTAFTVQHNADNVSLCQHGFVIFSPTPVECYFHLQSSPRSTCVVPEGTFLDYTHILYTRRHCDRHAHFRCK